MIIIKKVKSIGKKDFIKKKTKSGHIFKRGPCCARCDFYFNARLRPWFSRKKYGYDEVNDMDLF